MTSAISTGPRAAAARRDLGPTAWCALECLVERSDNDGVAVASVRAIAADLGVAKNTAHRAIAALVGAGFVELAQDRGPGGRFRLGHYRLHLGVLATTATTAEAVRTRPRRPSRVGSGQLSLLTPS